MVWQAALGALGGAGLSGGSNIGQMYLQSHEQFKKQRKLMKHAVTWRVGDMKRAGINPLMAVNPGGGAGGSATGGSQGNNKIDLLQAQLLAEQQRGAANAADATAGDAEMGRKLAELYRSGGGDKYVHGTAYDRAGGAASMILGHAAANAEEGVRSAAKHAYPSIQKIFANPKKQQLPSNWRDIEDEQTRRRRQRHPERYR